MVVVVIVPAIVGLVVVVVECVVVVGVVVVVGFVLVDIVSSYANRPRQ